ncbi:hypothetical protein [Sanguibacter sp. 25GB23B1]|uniref:hypothetical protein n=1 Tax=unclassified Sanguibacter TaxID=2645534 RepID=UPI0032AFC3B4
MSSASEVPSPGEVLPGSPEDEWVMLVSRTTSGVERAFLSWEDWACEPASVETTCAMVLDSMGFSADALAASIHDGRTLGTNGYVGEPPAELAELVTQTETAATTLSEAATTAGSTCAAAAATCTSDAVAAVAAYDDLTAQLADWAPYGG